MRSSARETAPLLALADAELEVAGEDDLETAGVIFDPEPLAAAKA